MEKATTKYVPALPGCVATGATLKETQRRIRQAIEIHIEALREVGLPVPKPTSRVDYVDVPEGTRVEVLPVEAQRSTTGMPEQDWPTTPEGIAALLARMDEIEPGWLSPEDDAAWRADLRARKELEKARFFEDAEKLRRMWQ